MSARDYRCLVSGVSLLGASCAGVLLAPREGVLRPVALPLFGRYWGAGFPQELDEGANYRLILDALLLARDQGQLGVDWAQLGVDPFALDDMEAFLSLVALGQLHAPLAITLHGAPLSFALLEANVAATFMDREPHGLEDVELFQLPERVLCNPIGCALYAGYLDLPLKLRLQFGLSFLGLSALDHEMQLLGVRWEPPGLGWEVVSEQSASWLREAWQRFGDQEDLLAALEEYVQNGELEDILQAEQ